MSRVPRKRSEADIYHVYLRGSGRQLIFEDDRDRRVFLHALALAADAADALLYAYCLMGNHYHIIVKTDYADLPSFAHKLNCAYATYFNKRHNRRGHLFENRYNSQPIDTDSYFLEAIRYVHRNPVESRIAPNCDYPWSSYGDYVTAKNNQVVFCNETVSLVGQPADRELVRPVISDAAKVLDMVGGPEFFRDFHSRPCKCKLVDDRPDSAAMTEADMLSIARSALQGCDPSLVKTLSKPDRDCELRRLKASILTQAQIALVTGLSISTVNRA